MDSRGTTQVMVVKRVRQSELGWFEACRIAGRETGRQRALNLDAEIVNELFAPSDDVELIEVDERWWNGSDFVEGRRPIRLQQKNWRLAGDAVRGDRFGDVHPDDLVFLHFELRERSKRWNLTWDVLSANDQRTASLYLMARDHLGGDSAVMVRDAACAQLLSAARRRLSSFGGDPYADTADLSDKDWEATVTWLRTYLTVQKLRALIDSDLEQDVKQVLRGLGGGRALEGDEAERVLRHFGTELLCDEERRKILVNSRFERAERPAPIGRWQRGAPAALRFTSALGLPLCMAGVPTREPDDFEDVDAFRPLGPLHDYQETVAAGLRELLSASKWEDRRGIAWMPTGTGKTRVTVETVLMHCNLEAPRNCVLWIADRDELCEQAVETFRHVWMVRGRDSRTARQGMAPTLRIIRLWGNRDWQEPPPHPTVIVASIQTLATRLEEAAEGPFWEELAILGERCSAVIFDEAHHVVAPSYGRVARALGLDRLKNYLGRNQTTAPPLIGLTATPARRDDDETAQLSRKFGGRLIEPEGEYRSLKGYQDARFLSHAKYESVATKHTIELRESERRQFEKFKVLPPSALKRTGASADRTQLIINDLEKRLPKLRSVLVFACNVAHARLLAEVLLRRGHRAQALDGSTPRPVRWRTIARFRAGALKVLVNCDLLATGFDAPNVDAVVLARPVESPILYAQMVGRGLRGEKNGGTASCQIIDYQDRFEELPDLEKLRMTFRDMFLAPKG
jgi:DNA repair protein RadD